MVSTPYPMSQQHQQNLPYSPISRNLNDRTVQPQSFQQLQDIVYSPKHNGLYLYLIRLLRPIWKKKCIIAPEGVSSLTYQHCAEILSELRALKAFLDELPMNNFQGWTRELFPPFDYLFFIFFSLNILNFQNIFRLFNHRSVK